MMETFQEDPPYEGEEEEPGDMVPEGDDDAGEASGGGGLDARVKELEDALAERDTQYRESSKEGKRLYHELQQTQQQLVNQQMAHMQSMTPPPPDPTAKHRETLSDSGTDPEAIDGLVQARVQQQVAATLQPFVHAAAQQQQMHIEVPEFSKNQVDIASFLKENPDVQRRYQALSGADIIGASEYALLRWRESQNRDAEAGMHAENEDQAAAKGRQRKAARPITSRSGRRSAQSSDSEEEIRKLEKAWEYGQNTGDNSEYVRRRLGPVIDKVKWAEE